MAGRALLIGSALDGLTGVENDVDAMAEVLTARGMTVERCTQDATRAGILAAYERLIAATEPGDAAVVFYSGHGGGSAPPQTGGPGPDLTDLQFIAPLDLHETKPGDFRGITSIELSVLLARLTQKTDNATVILDCCHSGRMSRGEEDLRIKRLAKQTDYEILRAHVELAKQQGLQTDLLRPTGNPYAVRIVACAPNQSAYEYPGEEGHQIGMLTEAVTRMLRAAQTEKVSWATVMDQVRNRVMTLEASQRPEAEGPSRRLVFETVEEDLLSSLRVTDLGGGQLNLECAPLLGVQQGDTFAIVRPGAAATDPAGKVGELTVTSVGPLSAQGPVTLASGVTEVPTGARAHRLKVAAPAFPVRLPADAPGAAALAQAVAQAPLLRVAEPDEHWLAEVRRGPYGELTVADHSGPLQGPRPAGDTGIAQAVRDLNVLARATALRKLTTNDRWKLAAPITLEWGVVRDGTRHPLPEAGATAHVGDPMYISVRNDDEHKPVYVSLLDIGVSGRIAVLTNFAPSGVLLAPGKEYAYGFNDYSGEMTGLPLIWPDGLDPAQARAETVLLLVTSAPQDVSALGQEAVSRGESASPLRAVLDQLFLGGSRDGSIADGPANRYDVHTIEFELDPIPAEGTFLLDESPDPAARHRVARGLAPDSLKSNTAKPNTVAVRIEELIVHRNRGVLSSDVRVDAIVLTGKTGGVRPVYHTRTERFSGIRDGDALPLDRVLVYQGPAADYLDIALWVSRDRSGSPDLGELLSDELADFEMQEALAKLGTSLTSVPYASAAAAAVGVGAVVVNLAYRLLRGSIGDVIGLYRGSRLAHEQFGAGRHPESGVRRVQDFSLAYSIEPLS